MTFSEDDLRALWRERGLTRAARGDCLEDGAWTRLLSGKIDAVERVRVASHIAACPACADDYRLLRPLQAWAADVERELSPAPRAESGRWRPWQSWLLSPQLLSAAAAVLLVSQAVVLFLFMSGRRSNSSLEGQLAENQRQLSASQSELGSLRDEIRRSNTGKEQAAAAEQQNAARLSTPQLDAPVVDLEPQFAPDLRAASGSPTVTVDQNAVTVTLVLNFPPLAARSTLEVEVAEADGPVRWTGRTTREQDATMLTLALPTVAYPEGRYVVRLFDVTSPRTRLGSYSVTIRRARGQAR